MPFDVTLSSVFVRDKKHTIIVGARGTVFSTENGGSSWKQIISNSKDHLYGVTFAGENKLTGWAVGTFGQILKTSDGGESWTPIIKEKRITEENLLKISAFDTEKAVIVGMNGIVLTTANGGENWTLTKPCENFLVSSAVYLSPEKLVAVGYGGCVAQSFNGGQTWKKIDVHSSADFLALSFCR